MSSDPISITVEGGTQEQASLIGDLVIGSLTDAGFTNVNAQFEGSDPESDVTKALRNLNPAIFDTEINVDAIGVVPGVESGGGDEEEADIDPEAD